MSVPALRLKSLISTLTFMIMVAMLPAQEEEVARPERSVVRVTVTSQGYDVYRPWQRSGRSSRVGLGALIDDNHFLVTATLVEDAVLVELERMDSGQQAPARVVVVDYTANLALLECTSEEFLKELRPLGLAPPAAIGAGVTAWQFEENGTPFLTDGVIRAIETAPYPYAERSLLVYRVEISLSRLTSSYVIPMISDGKLIGVLMQYDSNTRIMTVVSTPVIEHFVQDWRDGEYQGFPNLGISFAFLDDPQFRRYLEMSAQSGVYISELQPWSAAAEAGVKEGDVLIAVDNHTLDRNGEYIDPDFGRTSISHLISTRSFAGDVRQLRVVRQGNTEIIDVTLGVHNPYLEPIPPFLKDQAPSYLIEGGLVFTELSGEFLAAWGANWRTRAPRRLIYYKDHQYKFLKPNQRLVIVSYILPAASNIGYDGINNEVVMSVNGRRVYGLHDVRDAFRFPVGGFHEIVFQTNRQKVYLKAADLEVENQQIQQLYRLPSLMRLPER